MSLALIEKIFAYKLGQKEEERPSKIISIAMGSRTSKVVVVEKTEKGLELLGFSVHDTPMRDVMEASAYADALTEFFRKIKAASGGNISSAVLVLGYGETFLRHAEMP